MNFDRLTGGQNCRVRVMNVCAGGSQRGGIRCQGDFPDTRRSGIIIGDGENAVYGDAIASIGERPVGNEKLRIGCGALVWAHLTTVPILLRSKCSNGRPDAYSVSAVSRTFAAAKSGIFRGVFSIDPYAEELS